MKDKIFDLYYQIYRKGYKNSKNKQNLAQAFIYLRKIISFFYQKYLKNRTTISLCIDCVRFLARSFNVDDHVMHTST